MKNRGNDVFSKVRSNAPLRATATAAKRTRRGRRAHTEYIMHGIAASCASGVPSAKRSKEKDRASRRRYSLLLAIHRQCRATECERKRDR